MFHEGDLHSGIALAIQQQKLVAVFVRQDGGETDDTWQNEWLADKSLSDPKATLGESVARKAVLLKLDFGSQEASFLSAFCPIAVAPTLIIIRNGQVLEKLESGIEKDEFVRRLSGTVGLGSAMAEMEGGSKEEDVGETHSGVTEPHVNKGKGRAVDVEYSQAPAAAPAKAENAAEPQLSEREKVQREQEYLKSLMAERAKRHAEEKARRDAAEKQHRQERAKARKAEAGAANTSRTPAQNGEGSNGTSQNAKQDASARQDWLRQQKLQKDEAKHERQRILQQIENDKLERKRIQAEKQEAALADAAAGFGGSSDLPASHIASRSRTTGPVGSCALQVRLFDGSSIKSKFASDATLSTGVRTWISETAPAGALASEGNRGETPYAFRQILAPQPSRSIEISEEQMSLAELGLSPTATLVLVPIKNAQDAYSFTPGGVVSGTASGIFRILSGAVGVVGSALSYATGYGSSASADGPYMGGTQDAQEPSNAEGARIAGTDIGTSTGGNSGGSIAKSRVKTLSDRKADDTKKQQTEFYNGNSLGFEGRKDDENDQGPK
ncbi:hypothetical protein K431DRAFT_281612 [Polychaeton citri CBS 116435]|uniref:UBX domain-containing protein n=1 Tax=Polychaeton citri CBS 116435 TaxID=1314669 RepID=A0A9P4QF27_9PEZI|nr:hypothetical protein K431DRAFT_281612 [Polychaeton citri CBS 116435]